MFSTSVANALFFMKSGDTSDCLILFIAQILVRRGLTLGFTMFVHRKRKSQATPDYTDPGPGRLRPLVQ